MTKVNETTALLHFAEKAGCFLLSMKNYMTNLSGIVIRSRQDICFELKCGLRLTERM